MISPHVDCSTLFFFVTATIVQILASTNSRWGKANRGTHRASEASIRTALGSGGLIISPRSSSGGKGGHRLLTARRHSGIPRKIRGGKLKGEMGVAGVMPSAKGSVKGRVETLLSWMADNGVKYDDRALNFVVKDCPGCAGGQIQVMAREKIQAVTKVGRIPKSACLSVLNVPAVHSRIERFGLDEDDDLALSAAITHEMALGKQSRWYGYLSSLPEEGEFVPLLWEEDLLLCLKPSDLYNVVTVKKQRYAYFWETSVRPLLLDALDATASRCVAHSCP